MAGTRIVNLVMLLRTQSLPALLVTHLPDILYLTGFTGSNAALVVIDGPRPIARLFTDGRYTTQAKQEVQGATVSIAPKSIVAEACAYMAKRGVSKCGFDPVNTPVSTLKALQKSAREAHGIPSLFKPVDNPVTTLRMAKESVEIERMRRAAALTCELYEAMLSWIEAGMREIDVAAELEYRARRAGAERMSFETIVAAGERGSMPHARATSATLRAGDLLTLDFGIVLDGYCSDMTRTVAIGFGNHPVPARARARWSEQRTAFEAVLAAQQASVATVRAGVTCGQVDDAARSWLKRAGYGKYFTHSTGHGVGLEIHEAPRVAKGQTQPLQAGMVITIEPGVYLPGQFGIRIEDTVLVTQTGSEVLTPVHKGWTEL